MPIQYPPGFGEAPDFAGAYIAGSRLGLDKRAVEQQDIRLGQQDIRLQQQERSLDLEQERVEISRFSQSMAAALNAKDETTANTLYRLGMGEDPPPGLFSGLGGEDDIAKTTMDGLTVEGPRDMVRRFWAELSQDPSLLSDEPLDLGGDIGEIPKNLGFITRWTEMGLNISMEGEDTDPGSEFLRTLNQYTGLDKDDPNYDMRRRYLKNRLEKMSLPSGLKVRVNPDGSMEMIQGEVAGREPGAPGLTKPAQNVIDKELEKEGRRLFRLQRIKRQFRPEFQELPTRWSAMWAKAKAKMGGRPGVKGVLGAVSKEEATLLRDYNTYRMDALDNLNRYIQEITGAQMSVAEAKRLTKGMPDPGMGIFDGDDPISFEAKLNAKMEYLEMIMARYAYVQRNGLRIVKDEQGKNEFFLDHDGRPIEPEDMPRVIAARAEALKDQGMSVEQQTDALSHEFGLVPGRR